MQILQALLTPTIAVAVGVIGFLQWRTAHQKVMLDLFERRMKVIDEVNDALGHYWSNEGNLSDFNARRRLALAYSSSRYLFGEDVTTEIKRLVAFATELSLLKARLEKLVADGPERSEVIEKILLLEDAFEKWLISFPVLCLPYMTHDQRRIGTLGDWLAERNRKRLSYADKP
ncbi:hypothetical protein CO674_07225 [Rhizobium hidalgonense]|uniref:DUF4760 domain-containing protein n=1 Tax=Rhizobium hidalgonense TaxID=1538159 RepID=A0ABX4JX07_9HYPH|nr:hypothetical protein CO674_07225 [Rhizobium hidalgonense]PON04931.1 hypothetical protein ATY29_25715 [Rhizobium hidalgonense]